MKHDTFLRELRIRCAAENLRTLVDIRGWDYSKTLLSLVCLLDLDPSEVMGTVELYDQLRKPVLQVVASEEV